MINCAFGQIYESNPIKGIEPPYPKHPFLFEKYISEASPNASFNQGLISGAFHPGPAANLDN